MTDLLTFEDALVVLDEMHLAVGDDGLLASAVGRPAATVFAEDAYPISPARSRHCWRAWSVITPWSTATSVPDGPSP